RKKSQSSVRLETNYKPTRPLTTTSSTGWASPSTTPSSFPLSRKQESAANPTKKSVTTSAKTGSQPEQNPHELNRNVDQRFVGLAHLSGLCYHPAYGPPRVLLRHTPTLPGSGTCRSCQRCKAAER